MTAKISFVKTSLQSFDVSVGSNLMESLLDHDLPVASSCHGEGVCGKCKIKIVSGAKNLSEPNEIENFLVTQNNLKPDERISCQTQILGDVTIDAGYW
jgi:2Fe-2S ferredoxin